MQPPIAVSISAQDPISREGLNAQLAGWPEIILTDPGGKPAPSVGIIVSDAIDEQARQMVRVLKTSGCQRLLLIATKIDDAGLLAAVENGASGLLRRAEATGEQLLSAIKSVSQGSGQLPPDLLGRLLEQMGRLHSTALRPNGLSLSGLNDREVGVLRLVAEGMATSEIAASLCYSERTVKSVLHDITNRFNLRNRSHAVAYAVRQGLI